MICTAVAAVMELRMYCQRCGVRYVLRTVSTPAAERATHTSMYRARARKLLYDLEEFQSALDGK